MGTLLQLSLRQLAGRRRLLLLIISLAALPVAVAAIWTGLVGDGGSYRSSFVNGLLDGMIVAGVLPIVTMTLATAAFGHELEDHTLGYLVLNPIPRWWIALAKFLASVLVAGPLLIASGVATILLGLDLDWRSAATVAASLLVGVVTYSAIFTWAGLMTTRALSFALVYVFLWEGVTTTFLGGVRYLSVRGYTLALLHGFDGEAFDTLGPRAIEFPAALVGAGMVTFLFFWLTVRRLRKMDVA